MREVVSEVGRSDGVIWPVHLRQVKAARGAGGIVLVAEAQQLKAKLMPSNGQVRRPATRWSARRCRMALA